MSWDSYHSQSEQYASAALAAFQQGDFATAETLYRQAATAEVSALTALDRTKARTRGITAVSAVALYYKAKELMEAQTLACRLLAESSLPDFAIAQLQSALQTIWGELQARAAGVEFFRDDVFVSVRGGKVLTGGAPLDLILRKVEELRAIFYRTAELLLKRPIRKRGAAPLDIQQLFQPWLIQAPPGSYQFAVRVEKPKQLELELIPGASLAAEQLTRKFLEIVTYTAYDPDGALQEVVPDLDYRMIFLKLARNLAPAPTGAGASFSELEIRSEAKPTTGPIRFVSDSRRALNASLKKMKSQTPESPEETPMQLRGVLRALHLDHDWLEVTVFANGEQHIRVERTGEIIDDAVGPMVNRPVIVDTVRTPQGKYFFRDIQPAE
jgi:hypothetical protein